MTQNVKKRLINTEEYHKMIEVGILGKTDQVELINGEILYTSLIGSNHQSIIDKLTNLLASHLNKEAILRIQGPLHIKDWSEPEPDVMLLKAREDFYRHEHPGPQDVLLLIEVSDSTLDFDKKTKLPIYANAGIQEYWIINLQDNLVESYRQPGINVFKSITIAQGDDPLSCLCLPELTLTAKDILG